MKSNEVKTKEASRAVWGASPAGSAYGQGHEKGTPEFFQTVLDKRFTHECDWMFDVVQFERYKNKKVLEIGSGAGYDAYQFCKYGADYTGIDLTPDNPIIAQKHLSYFGYQAQFHEMDVEHLAVENQYDLVYSFGVIHHTPNIKKALQNIRAVLNDDGIAHILVYYKYSIFYIGEIIINKWLLRLQCLKKSLKDLRSEIEYSISNEKPLVNVYSAREFKKICDQAGFKVIKVDIRKLTHEDLPDIPFVRSFYKYIPQSWLNVLAKRWGWYLSVKMVKNNTKR